MAQNSENAANQNTPQPEAVRSAAEREAELLEEALNDSVDKKKTVRSEAGVAAYDEGVSVEHFLQLIKQPEDVDAMEQLIASKRQELERVYKEKGYTATQLKALNTAGKIENFNTVQQTLKDLEVFLRTVKFKLKTERKPDADVVRARHPQWVSVFPLHQALIDDLNALPENAKSASTSETAGEKKTAAAASEGVNDKKSEALDPENGDEPLSSKNERDSKPEQSETKDERDAFLDTVVDETLDIAGDPYAVNSIPEFQELVELVAATKERLQQARNEDPEMKGGMYGITSAQEMELGVVDQQIDEIKKLQKAVYSDMNVKSPDGETKDEKKPADDPETPPGDPGGGKEGDAAGKKEDDPETEPERKTGTDVILHPEADRFAKEEFVNDYKERIAKIRAYFTSEEVPEDAQGLIEPLLAQLDELERKLTEYESAEGRDMEQEEFIRGEFSKFKKNGIDAARKGNGENPDEESDRTSPAENGYKEAREKWKATREEWKGVKEQYETELQKYYEQLESRNMWHKLRGKNATKSPELLQLEEQYLDVRKRYIDSVKEGLQARAESRSPGKETSFTFENEKIRSAVAGRFIVDSSQEQLAMREKAIEEHRPEITKKLKSWFSSNKEQIRKWMLPVGIVSTFGIAYALKKVGEMQGGASGALLGKTTYIFSGVAMGALIGGVIGNQGVEHLSTKWRRRDAADSEKHARGEIKANTLEYLERQYLHAHQQLASSERLKRRATVGGAALGGVAGGVLAGMDGSEMDVVVTPEVPADPELPEEAPIPTPRPVDPELPEEAPIPTPRPVDPELPEEAPIPTPRPEVSPEMLYEVQEGDNLWNIMEERYAGMLDDFATEQEREAFLDIMKDYLAAEESSREALGVGPNIDLIHPGQELNFSSLDTLAEAVHREMLGGVDVDGGVVESGPGEVEPEPEPESAEAAAVVHVAEPGNNLWNIMEGEGPDANPIGGKSEVLHGMSHAEREHALDTLFDFMEDNPRFTEDVGLASGNPHKLGVGEEVNVSMMDEKLRELLGIETATAEDGIAEPSVEVAEADSAPVESVGEMRISDILQLHEDVGNNNQEAIERMNALDIERSELQRLVNTISESGTGDVDTSLTANEWLAETTGEPSVDPEPESNSGSNAISAEREQTPIAPEVLQERNEIVSSVEGEQGFFSLNFGTAGSFDKLQDVPMEEFEAAQADPASRYEFLREHGIKQSGFDRWATWTEDIKAQYDLQPQGGTTFGEYVTEVAKRNATPGITV